MLFKRETYIHTVSDSEEEIRVNAKERAWNSTFSLKKENRFVLYDDADDNKKKTPKREEGSF